MKHHRRTGSIPFGFTLIETLLGVVFFAITAGVAAPRVTGSVPGERIRRTTQEICRIETAIDRYRAAHGRLPDSLDQLGMPVPLDPWVHPYEYVNFASRGLSEQRAYHGMALNSDYDLYSRGPDGQTDLMINASPAEDDIVRGRDGEFVGVASEY